MIYEGHWKDGRYEGEGTFITPDGILSLPLLPLSCH
jgi:hypothetical protein